jgi:hypothetical protein
MNILNISTTKCPQALYDILRIRCIKQEHSTVQYPHRSLLFWKYCQLYPTQERKSEIYWDRDSLNYEFDPVETPNSEIFIFC